MAFYFCDFTCAYATRRARPRRLESEAADLACDRFGPGCEERPKLKALGLKGQCARRQRRNLLRPHYGYHVPEVPVLRAHLHFIDTAVQDVSSCELTCSCGCCACMLS